MLHACWGCVPPVRTRRLPPKPAKPEPNRDFERTPPSAVRALAKGAVIIPALIANRTSPSHMTFGSVDPG